MQLIFLVLPLAQITFLTPPSRGEETHFSSPVLLFIMLVVALVGLTIVRAALRPRRPVNRGHRSKRPRGPHRGGHASASAQATRLRNPILVDGSNVMHWKDEKPDILPVQSAIRELTRRGFTPGVVFDANAGYKLQGRYLSERDFSILLDLPESQIFVVPKGSQADPYLLDAARGFGARVVTRDRFRDWADSHPEVKEPGFLVRGGFRNTGEFWLAEVTPQTASAAT
jgi:Zc3h12a-like Ribonuclease NYN domain